MQARRYTLQNLGCANCAAKMEAAINRLPEVEQATITFATRLLELTAQDPDALLPVLQSTVQKIEPDVIILPEAESGCHCGHSHCEHVHHEDCGCEHAHEHRHEHHHEHHHEHTGGNGWLPLLIGAGLFLLGLVVKPLILPACLCAWVILGLPIFKDAAKHLVRGHMLDENFLMSIASLGAMVIGEYPEAVGILLFYRIGELFEEKAVARSRSQIMEAVDLRPQTVTLEDGRVIPAQEAKPGDRLIVRPGDRIPLDGLVVAGSSRLDTAPITGEPVPVKAAPGDTVLSGCMNLSGQLTLEAQKPLSESMVTRILHAVERAAAGKPKIDRFITRFSRVYTPVVVAVAVLTALLPPLFDGDWQYWVYTALSFLVMSCPCALVLSVPLAFFCGIGAGSKRGILFKGGASMEAMAQVRVAALDKTGTLTKGDFSVQQAPDELLQLCACCEQFSSHPVAVSIVAAARSRNLPLQRPAQTQELSGMGIRAQLDGHRILCGNRKLLEAFQISVPPLPEQAGTQVLLARDETYLGYLTVADTLKADAGSGVAQLKKQGLLPVILTGDTEESANQIAQQAGIGQVFARLLPEQKLQTLQQLRDQYGPVLFVGDGINDAPVLAGADVGGAMGTGADAAIEAADVVYMTSSVEAISQSLRIAGRTRTIAWQNVVFALAVKAVVMGLGLLGFASMWLAVFADSGVAMLCVLNALRVGRTADVDHAHPSDHR